LDIYTEELKGWLNNRFSSCDDNGVYIAHQPIYGFRNGPCESGHICRYIITYRLLESLSHLEFESLLDVGGAEGYKAFLANKIFGISVLSTDLSEDACKRAKEIFGIEANSSDIHNMLYKDDQFDVVMCSETLEHVADWKQATSELLRVARKAVVITVPQDCKKLIEQNKATKEMHSHIHHFDSGSFNYLKSEGYTVIVKKISSSFLVIPACLVDAMHRVHSENWRHPRIATHTYNMLTVMTKKIFGERTAAFLILLDRYFCMMFRSHKVNLFIILKNKDCKLKKRVAKNVSIREIVKFSVPHHYLIK
jgi:hypothetical protein